MKVFGVGLDLGDKIIDAIASAQSDVQANSEELDEIPVVETNALVHWSPLLHTVL